MKKIVLLSLLGVTLSSTYAAQLSLSPSTGTYIENCPFAVDIMVDMEGSSATTTDIALEYAPGTLTMHDFLKGDVFPDMFPPKIGEKTLDIVGMKYPGVVQGTGKIGTLIISSKENNSDAILNRKVKEFSKNSTADTNLSLSGFDMLTKTINGYYTFKKGECDSPYKNFLQQSITNEKFASGVQLVVENLNQKLAVEESKKQHGSALIGTVYQYKRYLIGIMIVTIALYLYLRTKNHEHN